LRGPSAWKYQRIAKCLLPPLLGITLLGASCAHISPTPAPHQGSDTSSIFAIVFSGNAQSSWQSNNQDKCWFNHLDANQHMTFNMPEAYKHTMQSTPAGEPDTFQLHETVTRTSSWDYRHTCSGPVPPIGPLKGSTPNCGTNQLVQDIQILDNGNGTFTISTPPGISLGDGVPDETDGQTSNDFKGCTSPIGNPYYDEKPLLVQFSQDDLHDGKKIVLKQKGIDTTGTITNGDETSSASVNWNLTMCRGASNLAFKDAEDITWTELRKSPSFETVFAQNANITVSNAPLREGRLGSNRIIGQDKPDSIIVDWAQMKTVFDLMGVDAHELGHSGDYDSKGYSPFLALPWLKYMGQYQVLLYQDELDASIFAVKVLNEVKQADEDIAPCIDAYIESGVNPYITAVAKGDLDTAKRQIMSGYEVNYQDFLRGQGEFTGSSPKFQPDPAVRQALTKVDFNQLSAYWGVPVHDYLRAIRIGARGALLKTHSRSLGQMFAAVGRGEAHTARRT
jgi:hypothetical protein